LHLFRELRLRLCAKRRKACSAFSRPAIRTHYGYLAGPRYRAAGPEITVTGGLGDERKQHVHAESFGMIADGPTEIRKAVRLCCREGVDNVKINISGDEFVSTARRSPR
jgi:imidazolonepropionase-like amidohydrolase